MEEKRYLQNQQEFDRYRNMVQFEFEKFYKLFYQERKRLQEASFEGWLKLIPPYQKIIQGINQFTQEGVKVIVATSNRKEFISRAFQPEYYNIAINEEDILDVTMGEDKSKQIKHIVRLYGIEYNKIYFIDDQLSHLMQTRDLGISVFLAGWSYTTQQQKEEADRKGIRVIGKEENFYSTLKEYMDS